MFPKFTEIYHNKTYPAISPSRPELSTAGKVVFITGGGSGIGRGIAKSFATAGSRQIAILGRDTGRLAATKKELEEEFVGLEVATFSADIIDADAVTAAFDGAKKVFGPLDILINNAGYFPSAGTVRDDDLGDWWKAFEVNVKGTAYVLRAFMNVAAAAPTVVQLSTAMVHAGPFPQFSAYSASKLAGNEVFTTFAAENPSVRAMVMHPGVIGTEMGKKAIAEGMPLVVDDISLPSDFTVWLVSPEAEFLKTKLVWSNWDVEELKARQAELQGSNQLSLGLHGWPRQ